jgi:uncharacterized damage-inducible protein DinB
MRRTLALFALLCVASAGQLAAQAAPPPPSVPAVATLAASFAEVASYVAKSAEQLPEADFTFKPTPEVRSFGQLFGHVAEVNYLVCSLVLGERNPGENVERDTTAKADLIAALRGSFATCQRAFAMTDGEAAAPVTLWGTEQPRLAGLTIVLTHTWEHYGNLVTYLRLKGRVPPSSQPQT